VIDRLREREIMIIFQNIIGIKIWNKVVMITITNVIDSMNIIIIIIIIIIIGMGNNGSG